MRRHSFLARGLGLVLFAAALARPATAATLIELGLDDLASCASAIAVADVVGETPHLDADGHVVTTFELRAVSHVGGERLDKAACLRQGGGTLGEQVTIVPGAPRLRVGARYLLFLEPQGACWRILGLSQGAWRLDDEGGAKVAIHELDARDDVHPSDVRVPAPLRADAAALVEQARALAAASDRAPCRFREPAK